MLATPSGTCKSQIIVHLVKAEVKAGAKSSLGANGRILSDDFRGPAAADVLKMRPGTCSPPASWARTGCNERLGFAASPTGQTSVV